MKTNLWMPLWIGDYLSDTTRLDTTQHGAYLLLIMDYWKNGPPPNDDTILARITGSSPDQWKQLRPTIEPFFQLNNGTWHHKRIDREMSFAVRNQTQIRQNSLKGVAARRALGQLPPEPKVQPPVEPKVEPLDNQRRTSSPSPSPSVQNPLPPGFNSGKLSPTAQSIKDQTELKRVEARLQSIRNSATITAHGKTFSEPQRSELDSLKLRRSQLLAALGFPA